MISAYAGQRRFSEATKLMEETHNLLKNTSEEGRAVIGNAELCLHTNEVDRAIEYLNQILPGQPFYLQAHTKLAEIHLNRRKDRNSFAKCFR